MRSRHGLRSTRIADQRRRGNAPRPPARMIAHMYDEAAQRLLEALIAAFGTTPRWELMPNRFYGFYLHYDEAGTELADVRDVIDATLNYSVGVILAPRGKAALPPNGSLAG